MVYVPELLGLSTKRYPKPKLFHTIQSFWKTLASSELFVREARYLNWEYLTTGILTVLGAFHVS